MKVSNWGSKARIQPLPARPSRGREASASGSSTADRAICRTIGRKSRSDSSSGMGERDVSRMRTVNERKGGRGGEGKRVVEREDSVAEKRSVRRSKTAIWCMRRWIIETSRLSAKRMRIQIACCSGKGRLVAVAVAAAGAISKEVQRLLGQKARS
ncbi:hypothetical protein HPP92_028048 [Vanilla planifolia]|uniref:Uncharacterized protein n=1 Tax=Vanilla planifolia TaxID=51239 RepID=A0A835U418_VANPL|nr:hypothetical protein HPP92_028048 [Vanilla planifolia]